MTLEAHIQNKSIYSILAIKQNFLPHETNEKLIFKDMTITYNSYRNVKFGINKRIGRKFYLTRTFN